MSFSRALATIGAALSLMVIAALVVPRNSNACSCGIESVVEPPDGVTNVPLNTAILIQDSDGADIHVRAVGGSAVTLQRTALNPARWLYLFRPAADLAPLTEYVIEVGDVDRSSFTTGKAVDSDAPAAPTLTVSSVWTAQLECLNSCEGYDDRRVSLDGTLNADPDVAYVELRFTGEAQQVVYLIPQDFEFLTSLSAATCAVVPPRMDPNDEWCIAATAIDVAGNVSEPSIDCFSVTECAAIDDCVSGSKDCQPLVVPDAGSEGDDDDDSGCVIHRGRKRSTSFASALLLVIVAVLVVRRSATRAERPRPRP